MRSVRRIHNPPNPFHATSLEWEEPPPEVELQIYEDHSKSILARNDSPDLPFTWSLNPYRGCMHACAYCYARPSHQYLDFGAGTDFDRKILVKRRAEHLLRKTFDKRSWKGELILFSGNTDCYQPLEHGFGLTRACLQVCLEYRNPVAVITRSALVERDVDVLASLAEQASCFVTVSVPFWDPDASRKVEPWAPHPKRRIRAIRALADAGIPVGVNVAPIIPGLNDPDIPAILEAAADAGATRAGHIMVRLPLPVSEESEPEPDVAVVPWRDSPGSGHSTGALLVVEIAESSLAKERLVKGALYAQCNVPEYWIVNLADRVVEVHTRPMNGRYADVTALERDGVLTTAAIPGLEIPVADLLK